MFIHNILWPSQAVKWELIVVILAINHDIMAVPGCEMGVNSGYLSH